MDSEEKKPLLSVIPLFIISILIITGGRMAKFYNSVTF